MAAVGLLLLVGWMISFWRFPAFGAQGEVVPLHYNIYFGVDSVGPWWRILMIPGFATLVFGLNVLILFGKSQDDRMMATLLLITSFLVALLCDVALVFILLANV